MKTITNYKFLLTIALSCSLCLALPAQAQSWEGQQEKLVVLEPIKFVRAQTNIEAVGTAEAFKSIVLYPAVADEVTEVNFVPGQKVTKGDVLVKLDNRRQIVAVTRAKLQLEDAERTLKRLQESRSRGAIAESELDVARVARDLAKVTLDEANADLEDRSIIAPFDGVVGLTDVEVGDRITATTAITTLDDRTKLYVNFRAPESSVDVLLEKPKVVLQPWTQRNERLNAEIAQLDSRISADDRTLGARAVLDNSRDKFRPGMSFRVNLSIDGEKYAAIPEAALLWGATGAYIWTAESGKAVRKDVKVHQRLRGTILVDGDLGEDDFLIAEGIQRLREGQQVTTQLARSTSE